MSLSLGQRLLQGEFESPDKAQALLAEILEPGRSDLEIAGALGILAARPVTPSHLAGFSRELMSRAVPISIDRDDFVDMCGTGGDGKNTFNISTLAALTAAASGVPVVKHGNVASTSHSGSSNVLTNLGIPLGKTPDEVRTQFDQHGIAFVHAPYFHPALGRLKDIRKALGFRTIFNSLGPLCNPANPPFVVTGVSSMELVRTFAETLAGANKQYSIVYALSGHDEVSMLGSAVMQSSRGRATLTPESFGAVAVDELDLNGGANEAEAADIFVRIARGEGATAQNSVVAANAALAVSVRNGSDLPDAYSQMTETLRSGEVFRLIERMRGAA